jgi:transketolase
MSVSLKLEIDIKIYRKREVVLIMQVSPDTIARLREKAYEIRKLTIKHVVEEGTGHIGGSLSEAEILAALYFEVLNIDPKNPKWEKRDRFVLSKAHACNALYAALALRDFFPVEALSGYCKPDNKYGIAQHPDMTKTPGIEMSGGSLGQGLSCAVGMAWAQRKLGNFNHVYCMIGDGESQEGQIWEAAMSASHHHLDNIAAILDYNKVQARGYVSDEMGIEPVEDKWKAFGWLTITIDGHDFEEILKALYTARYINRIGKPTIIIANTIKGYGLEFATFDAGYHSMKHGLSLETCMAALEKSYSRIIKGGQGV